MKAGYIVLGLFILFIVIPTLIMTPELRRYMRIRSM